MTTPPNNPPKDAPPKAPGSALRYTRFAIAAALLVGVCVFGVFAINELSQGVAPPPIPRDGFGASDALPGENHSRRRLPGDLEISGTNPLVDLSQDSNRILIDHHPGEFEPFRNSAQFEPTPYRQPIINGEVWEFCYYESDEGHPQDAFDHYNRLAKERGLDLISHGPSSDNTPGGMKAIWSDGRRGLELQAAPVRPRQPVRPPLRPTSPLGWVVKYSYPEPTD